MNLIAIFATFSIAFPPHATAMRSRLCSPTTSSQRPTERGDGSAYGDAVTPEPRVASFPLLLADNPAPVLKVYPKETAIAEKLEAIVSLGMANSRMKDYFDLYVLLGDSMADKAVLGNALRRTFERRRTSFPEGIPVGLSEDFATANGKNTQWRAFLSKNKLDAPTLHVVIASIRQSAMKLFTLESR